MIRNFLSLIKVNSNNFYNYFLNDPSTPKLYDKIELPIMGNLKYHVNDLNLMKAPSNNNERRAMNAYITVGNLINYFQENLNKNKIKKWSATNSLNINLYHSKDINAFYDRRSLCFSYYPFGGKTYFTGDSVDIVSHELGHALLDAIRPDFWNVQSIEIWAFHEAFSDICSMVTVMLNEKMLINILKEVNEDLHNSNFASRLAEEIGILLSKIQVREIKNCLRDPARQVFKYKNPLELPSNAPEEVLSSECHSFGRVFSSAWYNIFVNIYNLELTRNSALESIKKARDISFKILLDAVILSPKVNNYHEALAKCMISECRSKYPEYLELVYKSLSNWNIIKKEIKILSDTNWNDLIFNLKKEDVVIKKKQSKIIKLTRNNTIKLNNLSILSNGNNIELDVANENYYEFDNNGNLIDEVISNENDTIKMASYCYILSQQEVGNMWKIEENKLIRNHII